MATLPFSSLPSKAARVHGPPARQPPPSDRPGDLAAQFGCGPFRVATGRRAPPIAPLLPAARILAGDVARSRVHARGDLACMLGETYNAHCMRSSACYMKLKAHARRDPRRTLGETRAPLPARGALLRAHCTARHALPAGKDDERRQEAANRFIRNLPPLKDAPLSPGPAAAAPPSGVIIVRASRAVGARAVAGRSSSLLAGGWLTHPPRPAVELLAKVGAASPPPRRPHCLRRQEIGPSADLIVIRDRRCL